MLFLRRSAHHSHRVVVFAQPELEILQEVGGDVHEIVLGEMEHVLDVVEDAPADLRVGSVECGGLAHGD